MGKSTLRKIHLDELGLSVRSYAVLRRAGVDCMEDLIDCSIEDLKRIKNLGRKSLSEITERNDMIKAFVEAIPCFEFKRQVED